MQLDRAVIVHKKSVYQLYVEEHESQAVGAALDRGDRVAQRMIRSHQAQGRALETLTGALERLGIATVLRYRANLRSVRGYDLVVSLGGDGTLLDTSRRVLDETPLLGINSDPDVSVGALCAGTVADVDTLVADLRGGKRRPRATTRLRVTIGGEETLGPVLNDVLYAHSCPADLTRFELGVLDVERAHALRPEAAADQLEPVRGSGIWVCTAAGSTAAVRSAGGRVMPRGSRKLQYVLRETYVPPEQPLPRAPRSAMIEPGSALVLVNRARRGMVWADGPHRRVSVPYGETVVVDAHPLPLMLV